MLLHVLFFSVAWCRPVPSRAIPYRAVPCGVVVQAAMKESKEKAKTVFGGLFGKVSMYGDKEGVVVFSGNNPKCFFDVKVHTKLMYMPPSP